MVLCVEKRDKVFIFLEIINAEDHSSKFLQKKKNFTPIHSFQGDREGIPPQNIFTFYLTRTVRVRVSFSSLSVNSSHTMTRLRNENQSNGFSFVCLNWDQHIGSFLAGADGFKLELSQDRPAPLGSSFSAYTFSAPKYISSGRLTTCCYTNSFYRHTQKAP